VVFLGPGLLWLLIFFLYPLLNQASVSLMSGDPELANNPLVFPSDEIRAKLHAYPTLSDADERSMKTAMAQVTGA
jgi:ABC-type sugar transport system permease subunit